MNIKDFLKRNTGISQIVSTPFVYEKVRDTENTLPTEPTEGRTLSSAQSKQSLAALLILVGILFLYLNIKSYSLAGIVFGLFLLLIGLVYVIQLQKTIRAIRVRVAYEKVPLWYRLVSVGIIALAFLPLYLINTFVGTELGGAGLLLIPYWIGIIIPSLLFFHSLFVENKKHYKVQLLLQTYFSLGCILYGMFAFWVFSM